MNPASRLFVIVLVALCVMVRPVVAQDPAPTAVQSTPPTHNQVLSANPFGVLLGLFNAEFERKVSKSATAGIGGSFFEDGDDDYSNADVFFRYYPSGRPMDGWAFGIKAGVTSVDADSYFGFGFDANWSWLLGQNDNFYLGAGFGLKRLFGTADTDYVKFIPTVRLVNIGIAF